MPQKSPADVIREYVDAHGGMDAAMLIDGWYVWPTGARAEKSHEFGLGQMLDPPPPGSRDAAAIRLLVAEEHLRRATIAFNDLKSRLRSQGEEAITWSTSTAPPVPPSAAEIEQLKQLQADVQRLQADVAAARDEAEKLMPQGVRPRVPTQEHRWQLEAVLQEVVNIKI